MMLQLQYQSHSNFAAGWLGAGPDYIAQDEEDTHNVVTEWIRSVAVGI